jgi:hypothetical protein
MPVTRPVNGYAKLIAVGRGARTKPGVPALTVKMILAWADAYHTATRFWPKLNSGDIIGQPGETWAAVDAAFRNGTRNLPVGSSLARLLAERRGVRNKSALPRLTLKRIRAWARAHRDRTGAWPGQGSGPIPEAPGETWKAVQMALVQGLRGLKGRSSLARLLNKEKRVGPGGNC